MPEDFTFTPWRHGGWYTNVQYPTGACGCVSRNYADRKWRIVCDPRPDGHEHTYPNRTAAAAAERELVQLIRKQAPWASDLSDAALAHYLGDGRETLSWAGREAVRAESYKRPWVKPCADARIGEKPLQH